MTNKFDSTKSQAIQDEIEDLEQRLKAAKARLNHPYDSEVKATPPTNLIRSEGNQPSPNPNWEPL